jgi:hypothetical protein
MSEKIFPPFKYLTEVLEYNVAPVAKRAEVSEQLESAETLRFIEETPDYYPSSHNAAIMDAWLSLYALPHLCWNLTIAFNDLRQDGLLELAPQPEPLVVDRWAGVTLSRSDALAEYQPSDDEQEALSKVADDPNLNDSQRKVRLKKLALLAGKQRREFSNLKPGADPAIRV